MWHMCRGITPIVVPAHTCSTMSPLRAHACACMHVRPSVCGRVAFITRVAPGQPASRKSEGKKAGRFKCGCCWLEPWLVIGWFMRMRNENEMRRNLCGNLALIPTPGICPQPRPLHQTPIPEGPRARPHPQAFHLQQGRSPARTLQPRDSQRAGLALETRQATVNPHHPVDGQGLACSGD